MPKREWAEVPEGALVLSQSVVASLEISPCRVTTIPSGYRVQASPAMFNGTVTHGVIEKVVTGEWSPIKAINVSRIIDLAEELWAEEPHVEGTTLSDLMGDLFTWAGEVSMLVQSWAQGPWAATYSTYELVEAEVPRARYVCDLSNGQELWLVTGGIDAIFRTPSGLLIGVDWKTSGRKWAAANGSGLLQDEVYTFLIEEDYGPFDEFRFVAGSTSTYEWTEHPTYPTEASVEATLERIKGWAEFLVLENRPHLCRPSDGKQRGWWSKPQYSHGHCPTCRSIGDSTDLEWVHTPPAPLISTEDVTS